MLGNHGLSLFSRLNRSRQLWLDPTFSPPQSVIDELVASTSDFPVNELDTRISPTNVDHAFEQIEFVSRSWGAACARDAD